MCQRYISPVSYTTSKPAEHPAATQPWADAKLLMSEKRKITKIPLKIPKRARIRAVAVLADIIERATVGDDQSRKRFTSFSTVALSTSSSSNPQSRQSLTAAMKTNIGRLSALTSSQHYDGNDTVENAICLNFEPHIDS